MRFSEIHLNNTSPHKSGKKTTFDVHVYNFEENYRQLLHLLNFYTFNPQAPADQPKGHQEASYQLFLLEIARLSSNYFFAAQSLNQYVARTNPEAATLLTHPVNYFVKDLQHFSLSNALPIICSHALPTHLKRHKEPAIYFNKQNLLTWNEWHTMSQTFLDDQEDYFEILDVINLYATLTLDAQMHFFDTAHNV